MTDISHIHDFLGCATPAAWLDAAVADLPIIIQDHANCEKKAAGTGMQLMFRYEKYQDLQLKLAQLVREEMLHFEQVVGIMRERGQPWRLLPAGRYARELLKHKRTFEPEAMADVLIIGAFIEARSCERFAALADRLENDEPELTRYYRYLLKSESRHYEDYIALARTLYEGEVADQKTSKQQGGDKESVDERIAFFRTKEAELITAPDAELRFHSGVPA